MCYDARTRHRPYIARYVVKVRIDFGDGLHHGVHVPMMHRYLFLRSMRVHLHIGYVATHQNHIHPAQRKKRRAKFAASKVVAFRIVGI